METNGKGKKARAFVYSCVVACAAFFALLYVQRYYLAEWLPGDVTFILIVSGFFGIIAYLVLTFRRRSYVLAERMTEEVYASREWFRSIYEYSPTPYVLLSSLGRVRQPNKATLRLYGETAEDLHDRFFLDLFIEEDRDSARQYLEFFKHSQPIVDREMRVKGKDGRIRWTMLSIFTLGKAEEKDRYGLVALVDITERKEIERAKTEFVSLASHQLRSPLATMKWYLEALLSGAPGALNEKQLHYTEKIYRSNQVMIELVSLLLNVSRIEMGALKVAPEKVSLSHIADLVIDGLSLAIKQKSIAVKKEYEGGEDFSTDPKLMHIVIENLLSNAVKYTLDGGTITVGIKQKNASVEFSVSDTGCGIPSDVQDKIFTKLFRAENAKNIDPGGSGLGLYLSQAIAKTLNGSMHFTSELNKGTTFTVRVSPL